MKKKILILLLCFAMLASVFAGCKKTEETASPSQEVKASDEKKEEEPQTKEETTEKKVIKQLMGYTSTDPNEEPPVKLIEELTGYTLEFYTLPAENADEKLNLELSTGVEYDLMRLTKSQFYTLVGKGALVDFGDSMKEYAPNLLASFSDDEWKTGVYEDQQMGIPQFDARYIAYAIGYHKSIAKELGLEEPTTAEELTAFLTAVKQAKPDIIPLTGSGEICYPIASGFGVDNSWVEKDGQLVHRVQTDEYKAYLQYMAMLYAEGLIDEEWPINTGENQNEKFTTGQAFANMRAWWDAATINPAVEENTGSTVDYITLLNYNGEQYYPSGFGPGAFAAIPSTCSDVDEVMKYLNMRAESDILTASFLGHADVQYEARQMDDGSVEYWPIFPAFTEWFNANYFNICIPSKMFMSLWLCRVRKSEIMYDVFAQINDVQEVAYRMDPLSYAPPLEKVAQYTQSLNKLAEDFAIEIIIGSKTIENDYDEFIARWKADGGDEMIQEVNAWYSGQ